jgi:hypothetical protein
METSFQLRRINAIGGTSNLSRPITRATKAVQDEVAFENTRALTTALQGVPAVRDEVVRRATALVGDVNYPPAETIRRISRLLAIQLQEDAEAS